MQLIRSPTVSIRCRPYYGGLQCFCAKTLRNLRSRVRELRLPEYGPWRVPVNGSARSLKQCFAAAGGPPMVLRINNGPELISQALQSFCAGRVGMSYIPPWENGYIDSFNNRRRRECHRNRWTHLLKARVVIGDFKREHNRRHRHRRWAI